MDPLERITRRWERERRARKEAEALLELKSQALFRANEELVVLAADLAEKEERSRSVLQATADGILTIDAKGSIESLNPAACHIFGCREREAVGHTFEKFLDCSASGTTFETLLQQAVSSSRPLETLARRRDGTTVPIDLSVTTAEPLRQPIRILGVRDISARKQAEESRNRLEVQLRQAQKLEAIGQLAAGIAHEINTPVQYVGDNTRFLRDSFTEINTLCRAHERLLQAAHAGPVDPNLLAELEAQTAEVDLAYLGEEIPLAITQSLEGLGRIASIVRAMKDFSHPGSVEKTPADLNKALLSTVEISRNEWKYHAELETELDPALPLVPCLPGELNQVFLNIIVNAAHAIAQSLAEHPGHDKGRILISTRLAGDWAEVAIADSGTGVPEAIRSRIFDPFFTTKEVGKGSGQGLAIAYAVVVEKHAGSIEVENLPDGGARFVIRLPLQAAGEP